MVKKGECPKCKSSEVYTGANIKIKSGTYNSNTIPLGGLFGRQMVLDNYVCTNCGYVESYINNISDLEKIKANWERAW